MVPIPDGPNEKSKGTKNRKRKRGKRLFEKVHNGPKRRGKHTGRDEKRGPEKGTRREKQKLGVGCRRHSEECRQIERQIAGPGEGNTLNRWGKGEASDHLGEFSRDKL